MRALAPGLDPAYFAAATANLRIFALSTFAAGAAAVYCALLYTGRRFAPMAFYQAALNVFTIAARWCCGALGVYAFAIGYTAGACAQLAIVWFAARRELSAGAAEPLRGVTGARSWPSPPSSLSMRPALGLNIVFTRAYATHVGPGMAAALDYCMRGVGVPLALLVSPISNSLLPEIARLRSLARMRDAFRLIDRTVALTALAAVAGCGFAILFRRPAIATALPARQFHRRIHRAGGGRVPGLGPSMMGWSLIEITARSLFALDRPWPPVLAVAVPMACNVCVHAGRAFDPSRNGWAGAPRSACCWASLVLFTMLHAGRKRWV